MVIRARVARRVEEGNRLVSFVAERNLSSADERHGQPDVAPSHRGDRVDCGRIRRDLAVSKPEEVADGTFNARVILFFPPSPEHGSALHYRLLHLDEAASPRDGGSGMGRFCGPGGIDLRRIRV